MTRILLYLSIITASEDLLKTGRRPGKVKCQPGRWCREKEVKGPKRRHDFELVASKKKWK